MKINKKTFSKIAIVGLLSICGLSLCIAGVATAQDNTITIRENALTTSVETGITSVSTTAHKKKVITTTTTTTTIITTTNTTKNTEKTTTGVTSTTTETTPVESLAREKGEIKEKTQNKEELAESTPIEEVTTEPTIDNDSDIEYYLEIETESEPETEEESTELSGLYGVMQGTYYEGTVGSYGYYVDLVGELQSGYSIAVNGIPGGTLVYINCPSCPSLNGYHQVADIGGMGYDTVDFFYFYGETPSDFAYAGRVFDVYVYIC